MLRRPAALALIVTVLASTSPLSTSAATHAAPPSLLSLVRAHVKYVFVIYQENRSFDSYFGTYPGADGIYAKDGTPASSAVQPLIDTNGTMTTVRPFRIGPAQYAADTDDVDHSHSGIVAKMDVVDDVAKMDRFALTEERKYAPAGVPSLMAKQFGELTMAYEDCDTVPILWNYAKQFTLFDHVFQEMTGPSTPGNLAIIGAQSGITQRLRHPEMAAGGDNGDAGAGVPVLNDFDPFWGSPSDTTTTGRMPVNPGDFPATGKGYGIQRNLTFATVPLTLEGTALPKIAANDRDPDGDLTDVREDVSAIGASGAHPVPWGWYEEGFDREPADDDAGPLTAGGLHASYVTHHNGPQYFGYIANNPQEAAHLHGLDDLRTALAHHALPAGGGVFYVKGGYANILGLHPADPDAAVQKNFRGDDDHPAYSDAQISEAMVADVVNRIARSPYWKQSAIVLTWDDSEGDYDHVAPPIRRAVPGEAVQTDGPRVPLLVISPYARAHAIVHDVGDHASVVKLVDALFARTPLARLPDEAKASADATALLGHGLFGPEDDDASITDLLGAFDRDRLAGTKPPIPAQTAIVPDRLLHTIPQQSGYGCRAIGIVPVDVGLHLPNPIPADFNPRPRTNPSVAAP
jgi:phospholipase C